MLNVETRALKFAAVIWHMIDSKFLSGGPHIVRLTFALEMLQALLDSIRSLGAAQLDTTLLITSGPMGTTKETAVNLATVRNDLEQSLIRWITLMLAWIRNYYICARSSWGL